MHAHKTDAYNESEFFQHPQQGEQAVPASQRLDDLGNRYTPLKSEGTAVGYLQNPENQQRADALALIHQRRLAQVADERCKDV